MLPLHHSPIDLLTNSISYGIVRQSPARRSGKSRCGTPRRSTRYLPALASARRCGFRAAAAVCIRTHARIPQRNRAARIALVMRERAQRNHLFACTRTLRERAVRQAFRRIQAMLRAGAIEHYVAYLEGRGPCWFDKCLAAHKTYGRGPQLAPANRPCNADRQKRGNGGAERGPRVSRLQKPGVGWLVVLETFI